MKRFACIISFVFAAFTALAHFPRFGTDGTTVARLTSYAYYPAAYLAGSKPRFSAEQLRPTFVGSIVTTISTTDSNWPIQWRAIIEMAAGSHQLEAIALLPSGLFSTNKINAFTASATNQTATAYFDGGGFPTNRVWKIGTNIVRTLALTWDAKGRLLKVSDRDSSQSGLDWAAVYDAFDRLLRTTEITVTNANSLTNQPLVIDHFYDPEHEFLEVGVSEGGHVTWKVLGPDTDGTYGGQNGTGGFEAIVPGPTLFCPIISDIQGNLLAIYDPKHSGNLNWFPSRETGYGAVPGYRPVPIGQVGPDLGAKYAWRNRAMASIGLVYIGKNWYDPTAGQFISPDSGGHGSSPNLYSFCHGNPWAYWDADGRLGVSTLGAYGNSGRIPFQYRLDWILGRNFSWGDVDNRSFSRRAGEFAVNTVFNVPEITAGLEEVRHPDFSTPLGWLTFGTALIDVGANGIDAASNLIPGKALVEDTLKAGAKGLARLFIKDAAEDLAKVGAEQLGKPAAKGVEQGIE